MQNRMKGNLLVYPTSRAIREHLSNSLDSDGFLDSCLSIGDFFALSISTKNKTFISQEKRFLILQEAAKEIDLEKLAISSNFENFLKQSEYIFRFFDELSAEEISIEKLKEFDIYEEYIEHITLLERLFNDFCKLLDRDDFVDRVNLSRYSSINHNFLLRYNKIEIFLYSYLSKYEYHLLKQIAKDYDIDLIIETNRYNIEFINELFKTDFKEDEKIVYNLSTNSIISSYHIEKLEQKFANHHLIFE
jgi:ATP-dependent helicase/nuclease subunit B